LLKRLLDLHLIVDNCICLPVPSMSLKVLEEYVGFQREVKGTGDWAIAQYMMAIETGDSLLARELVESVLKYNEEDLDATWAVYRWLRDDVLPKF